MIPHDYFRRRRSMESFSTMPTAATIEDSLQKLRSGTIGPFTDDDVSSNRELYDLAWCVVDRYAHLSHYIDSVRKFRTLSSGKMSVAQRRGVLNTFFRICRELEGLSPAAIGTAQRT